MSQKLNVLARGTAMVFDLERHEAGVRRFVGRKHDRTLGFPDKDINGNVFMSGGWPPSHGPAEPDAVPSRAEYVSAVRDGDLWAADEATAKHCGVKFDALFGGEFDHLQPVSEPAPSSDITFVVDSDH